MARALSAFVEFTCCKCHFRASCDISTVWTEHQFLMSVHESVLIRYRWKAPDCSGFAVAAVPFCGIFFLISSSLSPPHICYVWRFRLSDNLTSSSRSCMVLALTKRSTFNLEGRKKKTRHPYAVVSSYLNVTEVSQCCSLSIVPFFLIRRSFRTTEPFRNGARHISRNVARTKQLIPRYIYEHCSGFNTSILSAVRLLHVYADLGYTLGVPPLRAGPPRR